MTVSCITQRDVLLLLLCANYCVFDCNLLSYLRLVLQRRRNGCKPGWDAWPFASATTDLGLPSQSQSAALLNTPHERSTKIFRASESRDLASPCLMSYATERKRNKKSEHVLDNNSQVQTELRHHRERKCADTTGTVLVPWAGHFQC